MILTPLLNAAQELNFDGENNLPIQIVESDAVNLWQIGTPLKPFFNQAKSFPNAIVTDTINSYSTNTAASFVLDFPYFEYLGFPYIQLEWMQKTDMEDGVDGGIIEASYDGGNTWLNVFNDTVYRPVVVGTYKWDTLYNGQAGITGKNDWNWIAICWGSYRGTPPETVENIQIKFTFISDSIDTKQEGWMIDNFYLQDGIIGSTSNLSNLQNILVYPSPTQKSIFIDVSDIRATDAKIDVYNSTGVEMFSQLIMIGSFNKIELDLAPYPNGIYNILLKTGESAYHQKVIKID